MGKVQKPLSYTVHPSLIETPEVKERVDKGHVVTCDFAMTDADIIIGPNCFRLTPETIKLLPLAEKAARDVKYPPKPKGDK